MKASSERIHEICDYLEYMWGEEWLDMMCCNLVPIKFLEVVEYLATRRESHRRIAQTIASLLLDGTMDRIAGEGKQKTS